jgi:hypothetical protein
MPVSRNAKPANKAVVFAAVAHFTDSGKSKQEQPPPIVTELDVIDAAKQKAASIQRVQFDNIGR